MSESLDGFSVAATRQNAGKLISVALNGVVNEPAGTACAIVIVVFGSESDARLSHVAACAGGAIASASDEHRVPSPESRAPTDPNIHLAEHGSGSHAVFSGNRL